MRELLKPFFREITMRKAVYLLLYPLLYVITFFALVKDSWFYFLVLSTSYFFCLDSVAIRGKDKFFVPDISHYFLKPVGLVSLFTYYTYGRMKVSLVLNLLPVMIFSFSMMVFFKDSLPMMEAKYSLVKFTAAILGSWFFYCLVSAPLVVAALRNKASLEILQPLSSILYLGLVLFQLDQIGILPYDFEYYIYMCYIILFASLVVGYIFVYKLLNSQRVFIRS